MSIRLLAILLSLLLTNASAAVSQRSLNNGQLILEDIPVIPAQVKADLQRYLNVRSAGFLDWSRNGEQIYIRTRFGDVAQIHRVDKAGGARHQLTFFTEPVRAVSRRPNADTLVYTMDAGGSEFAQIFLFNPKSGDSRMISDGESRNGALLWSPDGSRLAFQSTRRNGRSNDVWIMDPDKPESARLVLESPDGSWWGPVDFSPDGKFLLILNHVSANDSRIHLLDLSSGERRLLAGGGGNPSSNRPLAFDASGEGFFFITDQRGEFTQLAWTPLARPDKARIISSEIPWNVDNFSLSKDRKRAAFAVNADGISELYLLNPDNHKYRKVENLPVGLIGGLGFSPDARRMALNINTATSPSDVHVLDLNRKKRLLAGKRTRWTYSEVGGLDSESFIEPELIHYPTFDQAADGRPRLIPAFVYRARESGPRPVIVSIHGGPEGQSRPGFNSSYQMWVAKLGATVIVPNVRGSAGYGKSYLKLDNGFKREDSVKDIGALLDWIATQPDMDQNRVAVIGGSYGGYMVLAAATHYSDRLKAAVDIVGISNFVTFLENTKAYRRDLRRVEYGDERDPEMRAHLQKISPLNNVEKIRVPLFIVQGQNDPRVPVTEAEQMVEALRRNGQKVWYMNALNEGHGYRKKENRDIYQQAVMLFFQTHLQAVHGG